MHIQDLSKSNLQKNGIKSLIVHLDKYVIEAEGSQKKVYYYFYTFQGLKLIKETKLRYSEIKKIIEQVQNCLNYWGYKRLIPPFPGKKLLGRTNNNEKDLKERFNSLSQYFKSFFSYKCLYYFPEIQNTFFRIRSESKNFVQRNYNMKIQLDPEAKINLYKLIIYDLKTKKIHQICVSYQFLSKLHTSLKRQRILEIYGMPKKCEGSKQQFMKRKIDTENYFQKILSQDIEKSNCFSYFLNLAINFKEIIDRL